MVDAGPTRTETTKNTVFIKLDHFYAQALFSEDDDVVTWSNAPSCVMLVRSANKPLSAAASTNQEAARQ